MDRSRAEWVFSKLGTCSVADRWRIVRYINHGKSGAVFEATGETEKVALKIFDPELVERYGETVLRERIDRELLVGRAPHPNLVQIFDAGVYDGLHFIVMEYVEAPTLDVVLNALPRHRVRDLIRQVADGAEHLESIGIIHRDIKPANIAVLGDFETVKLLDFGVVRADRSKDITGPDEFLGTKRYAPPEFLARKERDNPEGWRAITFYQLGGVLHDMIMRRRLFDEYENDAQLLTAIASEVPALSVTDVSPDLVNLAQTCLIKNPELRLGLIDWDSFRRGERDTDNVAAFRARVATRRVTRGAPAAPGHSDTQTVTKDIRLQIEAAVRRIVIGNNQDFPPLRLSPVKDELFAIVFRAAKRFALNYALTIYVQISVADPLAQVVELASAAVICDDGEVAAPMLPPMDPALYLRPFYAGVFGTALVQVELESLLYKALDSAQAIEANTLSGKYVVVV